MSFEADFFDGASAQAHLVQVEVEYEDLIIRWNTQQLSWPLDKVQIQHFSNGRVRLNYEGAMLMLSPSQGRIFQEVAPQLAKRGRFERKKIPLLLIAISAALIFGYSFVQFGTQFLADRISYRQERWLFSHALTSLEELNCATEEQRESIWRMVQRIDDEKLIQRIFIIQSPMPNAFAYPGGVIAFTSNFFEFAESEEELLGILAHELQHIKQRHHLKGFLKSGMMSLIFKGATGGMDSSIVNIMQTIASNRYHVEDEKQADLDAAKLLEEKNLSVVGMSSFFERFSKENDHELKRLENFISTHPSDEKRMEYLKPFVDRSPIHKKILSSEAWKSLKKACFTQKPVEDRKSP